MAKQKSYHTIRYGTAEGEIKFGHVHSDNVISACQLRSGFTNDHYITLDGTGGEDFRTHSTTCVSPGSFQVKAGKGTPDEQPGILLDSENGDVVIMAPNGRVRISALDVEIRSTGSEGKRGNIIIDANEKVIMNGQIIDCKAKAAAKFFSENNCEISGKSVLNVYGGFIDMADGATSLKGSKPAIGTEWEIRNQIEGTV
jgi:hypothetical protein